MPVTFNVEQQRLTCLGASAPLPPIDGVVRLRRLVDRASLEIFGNAGQLVMPLAVVFRETERRPLALFSGGGTAELRSLTVPRCGAAGDRAGNERRRTARYLPPQRRRLLRSGGPSPQAVVHGRLVRRDGTRLQPGRPPLKAILLLHWYLFQGAYLGLATLPDPPRH